jgi:hypothetical protein
MITTGNYFIFFETPIRPATQYEDFDWVASPGKRIHFDCRFLKAL